MSPAKRRAADRLVDPATLTAVLVFVLLYFPFVWVNGRWYWGVDNIDLPSFHTAAVTAFRLGESPYDHARLQTMMEQPVYPFVYPPPSLLVFAPLAALSYAHARGALFVLNHLLILGIAIGVPLRFLRLAPGRDFPRWILGVAYTLTFYPFVVTLNHGQTNVVWVTTLFAFWLAMRRGRARAAGGLLALAILLKIYAVLVVLVLLPARRFREAAWTAIGCLAAAVASFVLLPGGVWRDWLHRVVPDGGYGRTPAGLFPPAAEWNQSLNGLFARMFTESEWSRPLVANPELGRRLAYVAAALVVLVSLAAALRCHSRMGSSSHERLVLLALPAMVLVAPYSWEHHLVIVLPSVLLLLTSRCAWPAAPRLAYHGGVAAAAILVGAPTLLRSRLAGVMLLWILGLVAATRDGISLPGETNADPGASVTPRGSSPAPRSASRS